jgi:hypothetical protein
MADGFLGRWSQRKQAVRAGLVAPEPVTPLATADVLSGGDSPVAGAAFQAGNTPIQGDGQIAGQAAQPTPTLDDVRALTADSSYAPFVARDVAPDVRNAAMKKLFADPHYQRMDRLDIYIDDYAQPSPLPASMLAQMASAQFLKLVDPPESAPETPTPPTTEPEPVAPAQIDTHHDHTDLRLQPDHAAAGQEPGRGAQ